MKEQDCTTKGEIMEFQRFVSYVYGYQDNVKQQNCGFVRVEVRQNMARFVVHMYLPQRRDIDYRIYGFVRKDTALEGVLLGVGKVKNGNVDIRIQMPSQSLGMREQEPASPVSIDDLSGMIMSGSDHSWFGTVWDDGEIDITTFKEMPAAAEKNSQEETAKKTEETRDTVEEQKEENEIPLVEQKIEQAETKEIKSGQSAAEGPDAALQDERTEGEIHIQEYQELADWESIRKNCPAVMPFEGTKEGEYYRIEPKDLKYLPQRLWHLGRNSFLLHGYYNYRYLILGHGREGVLLGVPGVYCPMEENVASMFGFRTFIPAMENGRTNGRFGYWCGRIYK